MGLARLRLASLWISQTARVMADNCLRLFVALELVRLGQAKEGGGWYLVTLLLMLPAVVLAPFNGALCNSLPKRLVLTGAAAYGLAVVAGFDFLNGPWLIGWALVASGSAVYGPVRSALLPAAASDTRWPLNRINALVEMGVALGVVIGLALAAGELPKRDDTLQLHALVSLPPPTLAIFLNLIALATALPVWFRSDVRRSEPARQAIAGFFRDLARIWRVKEARGCLIGLGLLRGLITAMMGALLADTLIGNGPPIDQWILIAIWIFGGVALGSLLAGMQRHPRRALGLAPWGATGLTVGLVIAAQGAIPGPVLCIVLGAMVGLINVPLATVYQVNLPADARGNGMAIRNFTDYTFVAILTGTLYVFSQWAGYAPALQLWLIAALAGIATLVCWRWLLREVFELLLELMLVPLYRIKGRGPGLDEFPMQGSALVIANHGSWIDPMWLAKILPRKLIPMMTSDFYDLPGIRWCMVHLAEAIRVPAVTFRRDVPEIAQAVAALDRGEVVIVFPEGAMRKRDDQPLRQFGQGVWHILRARPATPVFTCWIEGGWGSYFSYWNGAPTKNKKLDFRRRVDVAIAGPEVIDPAVLEDQRATRLHLMRKCVTARRILGLDVPELEKGTAAESAD
ncbi:MAG: MFS transporter [Planctomycetes bacterium]|nr:MFS transporter [Planctomycetota bacterium]